MMNCWACLNRAIGESKMLEWSGSCMFMNMKKSFRKAFKWDSPRHSHERGMFLLAKVNELLILFDMVSAAVLLSDVLKLG